MTTSQIHQGMPVVGSNGNQIGTVKAVNQNNILINRDWQRDVWAPSRAVRNVSGGAVHLSVSEDQIGNRNWSNPPIFGPSNPTYGRGRGTVPGYSTYGYPGYYPTTGYGNYGYGGYRFAPTGRGGYGTGTSFGTYPTNQNWGATNFGTYGTSFGTYENQNPDWGTYQYWRDQNQGRGQGQGANFGTYGDENWRGRNLGAYAPSQGTNYGYGTYQGSEGYTVYGVYPSNAGGYGTYTGSQTGFGGYGTYSGNLTGYGTYGMTTGWGGNANWANASDQDIESEVCHRLTQSGSVDASNVEVAVADRVVTLRGQVDSRRAKRTAEDVAESVPGVSDVNNELTVNQGLMQKIEKTL
ncbi:MAG TPA: BON domain-containing protein [Thermomicrobiaceae bacterium]|nr:BON domain-containing protein [Thermomicrobiaceae bacterium]